MKNVLPVSIASRESLADCDLLAVATFAGEAPEVAGLGEAWRAAVARAAARPGWEGREEQRTAATVAGANSPADGPAGSDIPGAVVALHGLGQRRELTWRKLAAWLTRVGDA